jgi:hypothetical protein
MKGYQSFTITVELCGMVLQVVLANQEAVVVGTLCKSSLALGFGLLRPSPGPLWAGGGEP